MQKKLYHLLLQAGLSEADTAVYLELLKCPAITKWELVGRTRLNRNTVYRAFDKLEQLKMIKRVEQVYKANTLSGLVAELYRQRRNKGKLAQRIEAIAPYLRMPSEAIQDIQTLITIEQIQEAFLEGAQRKFDWSLDFGDLENFAPHVGGLRLPIEFQKRRARHARAKAIMTTFGKITEYFCTRESKQDYQNTILRLPMSYQYQLVDFDSDTDYVLFHQFQPGKDLTSVLIKSRLVADFQRAQFRSFSQLLEK
ncbi:MAG: helix-turn-helix domain-containing protein [bacterium]|nr:helix-turn-helix domain-containing protein [bacterium]